ncbi:hypothetical protein KUT87_31035 [Pseudomonas aeruginosa]|nr:hypothetical protein [Pseudomonas aeruginosa]
MTHRIIHFKQQALLDPETYQAIFLAIPGVLGGSKIKASRRSGSPEFAIIGTENGTRYQ